MKALNLLVNGNHCNVLMQKYCSIFWLYFSEYRERDLSAGDYSRRDQVFLPPAPHGIPQPPGMTYYTQGVTGHHILSVKSFTKDQVNVEEE